MQHSHLSAEQIDDRRLRRVHRGALPYHDDLCRAIPDARHRLNLNSLRYGGFVSYPTDLNLRAVRRLERFDHNAALERARFVVPRWGGGDEA